MNIAIQQKKMVSVSKLLMKKYKHRSGSLNYFNIMVPGTPGSLYLKFRIFGFKYFFKFLYSYLKYMFSIGLHSEYEIVKSEKNKKKYKNIIITWAYKEDFNKNGTYNDRYFKINSKKYRETLWFLIYMSVEKPKKLDENLIVLFKNKRLFNFNILRFTTYLFKMLFNKTDSLKYFLLKISSFSSFSEIVLDSFLKNIKTEKIKKILIPYEGQPFQKEIIKVLRKKNKKLKVVGYDHTSPPPLPLNLHHDFLSPDVLLVNGSNQLGFYSRYLKWPRKKLKLVPSSRFQDEKKINFTNQVFLPYEILNQKIVLNEFSFLIKEGEIKKTTDLTIKNHPNASNSTTHLKLIYELKKLFNENHETNNPKKFFKSSAFFVGQTTAIILALELGLTSYHVCFEPTFDSYNSKLWRNIKVKQLSEYTFKYELVKKNAFTMIKKEKNIFKKYYDFKI